LHCIHWKRAEEEMPEGIIEEVKSQKDFPHFKV
jgi:hypothetical protein